MLVDPKQQLISQFQSIFNQQTQTIIFLSSGSFSNFTTYLNNLIKVDFERTLTIKQIQFFKDMAAVMGYHEDRMISLQRKISNVRQLNKYQQHYNDALLTGIRKEIQAFLNTFSVFQHKLHNSDSCFKTIRFYTRERENPEVFSLG